MDNGKLRNLIFELAHGDYPCSEKINLKKFLSRPEVHQALNIAYRAMREVDGIARSRWIPEKSGSEWREEEDQLLIEGFDRGVSINTLAAYHQRSESSIRSRLTGLGMRE